MQEARDALEPNHTNWVNMLAQRLAIVERSAYHLKDSASRVMRSRPGEAVLPDQPPAAPDHLL